MPLYDRVRTLKDVDVGGVLAVVNSIKRKTEVVNNSIDTFASEMFETVIFTTVNPIVYNLPAGTEELDGTTSVFINGGGGSVTIRVTTTIDGGVSDLVLQNIHDHSSLRYVHSNTTWYVV